MKIGITADANMQQTAPSRLKLANYVQKSLVDVLVKNDVVPVILPIVKSAMVAEMVRMVDAIIIPGGPDVSPHLYGEDPYQQIGVTYVPRDDFEKAVIEESVRQNKPVLGICRGIQIINVAFGGTLYQDLPSQYEQEAIRHEQVPDSAFPTHFVIVEEKSFLAKSQGAHPFVNSKHHQAVKKIADGFKVTARAKDGVIEAIENPDLAVYGVQWHPETFWSDHEKQEKLFQDFFALVAEKSPNELNSERN
ncbi:gamma-glutamyl-gamma-aminobutyrate hydrolase family protein [Fructobacillus americanaquae]|uniref:Gamma-glutamyl-gamma-aminobutyrate hydrolase family protein n=1 Tax=Fructobacillus americanaquae TaxID=2940302 RepID=A0ABY5C049_9LACO|nr:gamma-glutamyl-gamma-aminobutyrate hydrolase family protein [Fructobacillus americanaquae]USS91742.1 gamma-glutamyl-gamma-aminobutyrate hydrolase family protein [Fructobacillus americanaquae]